MFSKMTDFLGGTAKRPAEATGAYDGARTHEFKSQAAGATSGIVAGTKVATHMGWRPVEAIAIGDRVLTFDGGLQVVTGIERDLIWQNHDDRRGAMWMLSVPSGALGNQDALHLLPDQSVIVESDLAEELFGDPFALLPALSLEGFRGIERVAVEGQIEVITLKFETDQVVFANFGALFHCPSAGEVNFLDAIMQAPVASRYQPLSYQVSSAFVDELADEEAGVVHAEPAPDADFHAVA